MKALPKSNVGLGGDGDEIAAIREVEDEFGVRLDYADAHEWSTAGDVYAALCKALPAEEVTTSETWERFTAALCRETGVAATTITPESELLCEDGRWISVTWVGAVVWVGIGLAAVATIAWLLR